MVRIYKSQLNRFAYVTLKKSRVFKHIQPFLVSVVDDVNILCTTEPARSMAKLSEVR